MRTYEDVMKDLEKQGLFTLDPEKVNDVYINKLNILDNDVTEGMSIIDTIKIVNGGEYHAYQIVVTARDITSLCFSVNEISTFYPVSADDKVAYKTVCRVYLPTMQMIRYSESVNSTICSLIYESLMFITENSFNLDFMVDFIVNELRAMNKRGDKIKDHEIPYIGEYIKDIFHTISDQYGFDKYWMNSSIDCFKTKFNVSSKNDIDDEPKMYDRGNGLNYDMGDMYYFIKSEDLRNYLHAQQINLTSWDQAYLLYNSGLNHVSITNGLREIAEITLDNELKRQISSKVDYMEDVRNKFRSTNPDMVFMGIRQYQEVPLLKAFRNFEDCHDYMMKLSKCKPFKICKLNVIDGTDDNYAVAGNASFNEVGEAISYSWNKCGYAIGCDEKRFESHTDLVLPHPFRSGDIVTNGESNFIITAPCCDDSMNKMMNDIKNSPLNYMGTDRFCIPAYRMNNNGVPMKVKLDIREISFVNESDKMDLLGQAISKAHL